MSDGGSRKKKVKLCRFCGQHNELAAEFCSECRRPLGDGNIITLEEPIELPTKSEDEAVPKIERFGAGVAKEPAPKEIPRLNVESTSEALSRVIKHSKVGVPRKREIKAPEISGDVEFKVIGLDVEAPTYEEKKEEERKEPLQKEKPKAEELPELAEPMPTVKVEEKPKAAPKTDVVSIHEKIQQRKRAIAEETAKAQRSYWRRLRRKEVAILFMVKVAPWFALSAAALLLLPLIGTLFPQGTWHGRIFDATGVALFELKLERQGAQLYGTIDLRRDARIENIPFVLEGVWDGKSPLKVRGKFRHNELELLVYPEYNRQIKIVLSGKWTRNEAVGEAWNFRHIRGRWDMER